MTAIKINGDVEARRSAALAWVAASLPASLTLGTETSDIHTVEGAAGWTERAIRALRAGAEGVVVVAPEPEETADLRAIAAEQGGFVILDQRWRSNPAVSEAREAVRSLNAPLSAVSVAVNVQATDDVERALHESLQIAHFVIGDVEDVRLLQRHSQTALVAGTVSGAPLTINVAVGPAIVHPFRLHAVALSGGVHLSLPDPATATPGLVRIVHAEGETTLPTRWESAHRAAWRRAIAAFELRDRPDDLAEFATTNTLLTEASSAPALRRS